MNKDRYKSELNSIKPDQRLVQNTINLLREKEEQRERKSIFSFNKLAVGFCSIVILGSVGYTYFNYNTISKENNASKEKNKYASSTIYKIEKGVSNILSNINEIDKKVSDKEFTYEKGTTPTKVIGLDKISESDFTGMYLVRETNNSKWKLYKHTKEYINFKEFISRVDDLASGSNVKLIKSKNSYENSYLKIKDNRGSATIEKDTMLVKIGHNYLAYIPKNINNPIVVQLLGANDITVYSIELDSKKQSSLNELRNFIATTGTEIKEDEQESIDRNIKSFENGKEDKTNKYGDMIFNIKTQEVEIKYTATKKIFIVTFYKDNNSINNPKVEYNREYSIDFFKGKVESAQLEYLGSNEYPYIVVLTTNKEVYYIDTKEWIKNGKPEIKKVASNATKIERSKDKYDRSKMYATINGKKTELSIGDFNDIVNTTIIKDSKDINVKYLSDNGKLLIKFYDTFKNEIDNPKIQLNKEIEVDFFRNNVKDLEIAYIANDTYPSLVILTSSGEVYRISTSKWVSKGDYELIRLTKDASKIEIGKDLNGNDAIYATVNGKKINI